MTLIGSVIISWLLAYFRAGLWIWTAAAGVLLWSVSHPGGSIFSLMGWALFVLAALILNLPPVRRTILARPLLRLFKRILPPLSETEREALEAGTVGWDGELFSGNPDWRKLLSLPPPRLTAAEQAFLDGPVEELCRMLDDWQIVEQEKDLPPAVWQFIKQAALLRHDHPDRIRRPRFLRPGPLPGDHEDRQPQRHRCGDGDGAQLARTRRNCCSITAPRPRRITTCRFWPGARRSPALP